MTEEIWESIPGWEGFYEASSLGGVRSVSRVINQGLGRRQYVGVDISPIALSSGYFAVNLTAEGRRAQKGVHALVVSAFSGKAPLGCQVRHLNGNKWDNRAENLKWGTAQENADDRRTHGTAPLGERVHNSKLTPEIVRSLRSGELRPCVAVKQLGVNISCIDKAKRRETWRHVL